MMNVAVMIYDGVELVDMCGPTDVFLHANGIQPGSYHLYTVAESKQPVRSEGAAVTILPAYDFGDCPEPDILIVPGLLDADLVPAVASAASVAFIGRIVLKGKIILSVCVGLFNVAATGLLGGKRVTTHYLALPSFQQQHPDLQVVKNKRVVQDGNLVSTGGITSGIDGALHLLESLRGGAIAQQVADIMVYNRAAPLPEYTLLPPYDPRA